MSEMIDTPLQAQLPLQAVNTAQQAPSPQAGEPAIYGRKEELPQDKAASDPVSNPQTAQAQQTGQPQQPGQSGQPQQMQQHGQQGQAAQTGQAVQTTQDTQAATQPPLLDQDAMPISDWSKVDLQLPEGAADASMVESFGKVAVEHGLTPGQARALANWQIEEAAARNEAYIKEQTQLLTKMWGPDAGRCQARVMAVLQQLDRVPGLESFSREFQASGAASNAVVIAGIDHLARMTGEDMTGRTQALNSKGTETAYEGICDVFARARRER